MEGLGDGVEVRKYAKRIWATAFSKDENSALSILLQYISGGNKKKTSIATAAPVMIKTVAKGVYMYFCMPEGIDLKDLPEPLSKDVELKELPARTMAVIAFTGYMSPEDFDRGKRILEKKLNAKGKKIKDGPFILGYDSPAAPYHMRRSEVAYEI